MVKSCAAIHCTNRQGCEKSSGHCESISFHSFPLNDPCRLQQWVLALRREQWNPNQYSAVCSEHFKATDFIYCPNGKKRRLKPEAVPSFFKYPQARSTALGHHTHRQHRVQILDEHVGLESVGIGQEIIPDRPTLMSPSYFVNKHMKTARRDYDDSEVQPKRTTTLTEEKVKHKSSSVHRCHKRKKVKHSVDYNISSIQNVIDETQKRNLISVEYADFVKFLIKP